MILQQIEAPREGRPAVGRTIAAAALCMAAATTSCFNDQEGPARIEESRPRGEILKAPAPLFDDEARDRPAAARPRTEAGARRDREAIGGSPAPSIWKGSPAPGDRRVPAASSGTGPSVESGAAGARQVSPPGAAPAGGEPSPAARTAPTSRDPADPLDDLFESWRARFRDASALPAGDPYAAIERAECEAKLIALFFLRDRKRLEDIREIIRSLRDDGPVNVEAELLRAALYQKLGLADQRDRAIERAQGGIAPAAAALKVSNLAFAREIRGWRSFTPAAGSEFARGDDLLLYGEIEGFRSVPVERPGRAAAHRRSFAAELVLRDGAGKEVDRRMLLKPGAAVELVEDPARPVHFWGRYPIPAGIAAGAYRLEVDVQDLEGARRARGGLGLKVR